MRERLKTVTRTPPSFQPLSLTVRLGVGRAKRRRSHGLQRGKVLQPRRKGRLPPQSFGTTGISRKDGVGPPVYTRIRPP